MNILGLVFPASFFQHDDQNQYWENNASMPKCSGIGDISKPLQNATEGTSQGVEFEENPNDIQTWHKSSDDQAQLSRYSPGGRSSGLISKSSNLNEPIITKSKKKKKKGKSKRCSTNGTALGTISLATSTCSSPQSSQDATSVSAGSTEHSQSNATVCCHSSKVAKKNPAHKKVHYKCKPSTLNSEGSATLVISDNTECISGINKESSEVILQDSRSCYQNIGKTSSAKKAGNQGKGTETSEISAFNTSVTGREQVATCLKDESDSKIKQFIASSCYQSSDVLTSQMLPRSSLTERTEFLENRSSENGYGVGILNTAQNVVIVDSNNSNTQQDIEVCSSRSRPVVCLGPKSTLRTPTGVEEVCSKIEGTDTDEHKSSTLSSKVSDAHAETSRRQFKTLSDATFKYNSTNYHNQSAKDTSYFIQQKSGMTIGQMKSHGRRADNDYLDMNTGSLDHFSLMKQNRTEGNGKLPRQSTYISRDGLWRRKVPGTSYQESHRTYGCVPLDSCAWTVERGFSNRFGRSRDKLNQTFQQQNANHYKRGFWIRKANTYKPQNWLNDIHSKTSEVPWRTAFRHSTEERCGQKNYPSQCISSEADVRDSFPSIFTPSQGHLSTQESNHPVVLHEIKPHTEMKILTTENVLVEATPASFNDEDESPAFSNIEHSFEGDTYKHVTSIVHSQKGDFDASKMGKIKLPQEMDSVVDGHTEAMQRNCLEDGETGFFLNNKSTISSLHVSSKMAQVLLAAYTLQLASERVHLATGTPIAEFEKLLCSASPVIVPSFSTQHREIVNEPIPNPLCKFQNPDFMLGDVWSWYERPGNYGLKVKAEKPHNSKGIETNRDFYAYFVPFLSAVQLFGHSHHSLAGRSPGNLSIKIPESKSKKFLFSSPHLNLSCPVTAEGTVSDQPISVEKYMRPCNIATSNGNACWHSASAFSFPDDSEVILEFFEHELPQQRKPLHLKLKDLIEAGTSNSLLYGDPSMLEYANLQDLHPASWFSIAWYPIYQIPEGNLRGSFLTYHSLGHILCSPKSNSAEENDFSLVFPVLGMQSYNAQGECWFLPKKFAADIPKDGMPFDSSEILQERLRTLEETAAFFARGNAKKNNISTSNKQPDYEFFLTRRSRP